MKPLYLVAEIFPKPDSIELARREFEELMAKTRAEKGCLLYDLVQEDQSEGWLMLEKWESREHWEAHNQSDHVKHINSQTELFSKPTHLRFMTEVQL